MLLENTVKIKYLLLQISGALLAAALFAYCSMMLRILRLQLNYTRMLSSLPPAAATAVGQRSQ